MPYTIGQDFRLGVDRRRRRVAGPPGSLWDLENAHLTRGGDVEKRMKFVAMWTVPANTFGLKVSTGAVYVFGSAAPGTLTIPAGVTYQQFVAPSGADMTALNDVCLFNGLIYASATFSDGGTYHFYNGVWVQSWQDGVVQSYTTSLSQIAARIAALINANTAELATATSAGNVVTITGNTPNIPLSVTAEAVSGGVLTDQTAVALTTRAASVSVPEITTVTLGGSLQLGNRFSVFVGTGTGHAYGADGNPLSMGLKLITYGAKIYAMVGSLAYFCAVDDPMTWRANLNGGGFINVANQEQGSVTITGAGKYYTQMAFFSTDSVQIWTLDPDPTINAISQTLLATGALAGRSVAPYGNNDTFYLSRSGLRSLRQRSVTGAPFANDSGNSIDALLIAEMLALGTTTTSLANGAIETINGRYMLALGTKIYVLSDFPGSKISAWSWYAPTEIPNFSADWVSVDLGNYYVRSGNTIYLYGGANGSTYDSSSEDNYVVTVGLPFSGGRKTNTDKVATAYEVSVINTWLIEALIDPRNENIRVTAGLATEDTYPDQIHPSSFDGKAFAMQFTCSTPGPATLTNYALAYEELETLEGL